MPTSLWCTALDLKAYSSFIYGTSHPNQSFVLIPAQNPQMRSYVPAYVVRSSI